MRAFRRAAVAWSQGKYHKAWEIIAVAGFEDHWNTFLSTALIRARRNFRVRMSR